MEPSFHLWAWLLSFEPGLQNLFGSERLDWIWTGFLFHASVAYSTLCSVAYTRERNDSSQPVCADIIMTSVAFCWRPLHSGLCGFHYDSMVSISPNFKRGLGMKTGFNPGWTLTHNFESPPSRLQTWSVQTRRLSVSGINTYLHIHKTCT